MNAVSYSGAEIHILMPAWPWLCLLVGFFGGGGWKCDSLGEPITNQVLLSDPKYIHYINKVSHVLRSNPIY